MPFERDNLLDALVAAENALDKLAEELVKAAAAELTGRGASGQNPLAMKEPPVCSWITTRFWSTSRTSTSVFAVDSRSLRSPVKDVGSASRAALPCTLTS